MTNLTLRGTICAAGLALTASLAACGSGAGSASGPTSSGASSSTTTSSSASSSSTASTTTSASPPSPSAGRTVTVKVTGNKVSPPPSTVSIAVGEQLTVSVTSDHADRLHVHGFDVEKELPAGQPVTVTLTGRTPGVYEVESHHPELRLLKIAVR